MTNQPTINSNRPDDVKPTRRPWAYAALALGALALGTAPGCGKSPPSNTRPAATQPTSAPSSQIYKLTGVVRLVKPGDGLVTIRHDAIPGFMDAMTMPFTLKDRKWLDDVQVGDEVEGRLRVVCERGEVTDYELIDLVVSRPAPAPALILKSDLGGAGGATVQAAAPVLKPGDAVPDFALTGADGKTFRLSSLRGKVVALTFIYTRCPLPDFCPRLDAKFAEATSTARKAGSLRFLSVSFDPEHDTPAVLTRHARARGAKPPLWTFAVATHDELAKVAGQLGLAYGPTRDEIMHNLIVAIVGADGRLVRLETGAAARDWSAAELLKTMYSSISGPNG